MSTDVSRMSADVSGRNQGSWREARLFSTDSPGDSSKGSERYSEACLMPKGANGYSPIPQWPHESHYTFWLRANYHNTTPKAA